MPPDNSATVPAGGAVSFPQDGPADGSSTISRLSASTFNLAAIGTYEVAFQVSVTEAGQLELNLNSVEQPATVVGRALGTTQIWADVLIQTTTINSVLEVDAAPGNISALTITPLAGGTQPVSATLVIRQLSSSLPPP
jgi:hypothetical protein